MGILSSFFADKFRARGVAVAWLLFLCLPLHCENIVQGRVVDDSGEGIFAANVFLRPTFRVATATELDGSFELTVPETAVSDTLTVSFIGYSTYCVPLSKVDTGIITVALKEDNRLLGAVFVESRPETAEEFSLEKLDRLDIYLSPVANGDPLNAITFLPASTNTDESANPSFRGSAANASQVLLNGIPIADPVRNTEINGLGNFSLFNTSLIDGLTVYAGNPPLSKSNATAGMTDIRTARQIDCSHTECSLSLANIGVLRSQVLGSKSHGRCFVQGYTNWQFHEPYTTLNNASSQIESFRTNDAGLNLHFGKEHTSAGSLAEGNLYAYFIDESFKGSSYLNTSKTVTSADNRRGFAVAGFRYMHERLACEISLGADISDGAIQTDSLASNATTGRETDHRFHLNAVIKHYLTDRLWIEGGISTDYSKVDMTVSRPADPYDRRVEAPVLHTDTTLQLLTPELFLYARYEIIDGLTAGGGLRGDIGGCGVFEGIQTSRYNSTLSGQANIRYTRGFHSWLLSGGVYHGHIAPTLYLPCFSSSESRQASLEYGFRKGDTNIEASLYRKRENGREFISYRNEATDTERHITGIEVSASQDVSHLRLGLSYTCLLSGTLIDGKLYKSANHLPWWVKGSMQYAADDGFTMSLSGQIRPGTRYTPVVEGRWDETAQQYFPVFGEHDSERLDAYSRVDMGLNKVIGIGQRAQGVIFATFSNIFNRGNEAGVIYLPDYSGKAGSYCFQSYTVYFGVQVVF